MYADKLLNTLKVWVEKILIHIMVCTSVRGYTRVCAGMHGCSVGVCRCGRECAGVRRFASGYACVCGMNFQNFFQRIESLHQRTLIRILYEFFSLSPEINNRLGYRSLFKNYHYLFEELYFMLWKNSKMEISYFLHIIPSGNY